MPIKENKPPDRDYFFSVSERLNKSENRLNIMELNVKNTEKYLETYIQEAKEHRIDSHKANTEQNAALREIQDSLILMRGAGWGVGKVGAMFVASVSFACGIIALLIKIKGA